MLPELGSRLVADLTVADVRRLLDTLAAKHLSPRSRSGLLGILSGLLAYGIKHGALERNVVRDLDRDDRPGAARLTEPRYRSSADDLEWLLDQMGDTFRPVAAVCARTRGYGYPRHSGFRWRDIDLKAGTISVTAQFGADGARVPLKTPASAATVPMLSTLTDELHGHRSRIPAQMFTRMFDALVFVTASGRPHSRRNVLRAVYAAGNAAGLNGENREPVGVHDLRHSFVAIALAVGLTLPEAAALARHANPRVTATVYAGLTDQSREQLAAKLAKAFGR